LPVFARAGAFIPQAQYKNGKIENVGDYNPNKLDIVYYPSEEPSQYTLFDDDLKSTGTLAEGKHRLIHFVAAPQGNSCTITIKGEGAGTPAKKEYRLIIPGLEVKPSMVKVNGKKVKVNYDKTIPTITIPLTINDINVVTNVIIEK
jgi:hypothetical protein